MNFHLARIFGPRDFTAERRSRTQACLSFLRMSRCTCAFRGTMPITEPYRRIYLVLRKFVGGASAFSEVLGDASRNYIAAFEL